MLLGAFGGAGLGAAAGGIVGYFTSQYILKRVPNHSGQIDATNKALVALAVSQEEMRKQHAEAVEANARRHQEAVRLAEAARWKPNVKILSSVQGSAQLNLLRLESLQEFALLEACLLSPSGMKIADYAVSGPKRRATGFNVPITHGSLLKIANASQSYFQTGSFDAAIRFVAQCAGHPGTYSADVPIRAEMTTVGNTLFFKLTG